MTKKTMRNGTFLRDGNGLTDLLGLPFGYIIVAGTNEQIPVLTQDEVRLNLGMLSTIGEISFNTADQITKQVKYARLVNGIADVARQVDKFRLPRDYRRSENFRMCYDGKHGHFQFKGLNPLEGALNPIDSFAFGVRIACDLVADGNVKPMDAVWALQQIRGSRLPITAEIVDKPQAGGLMSLLTEVFGPDMVELDFADLGDLFASFMGSHPTEPRRPATRPPEQKAKGSEPTVTVPPPAPTGTEAASASAGQQS